MDPRRLYWFFAHSIRARIRSFTRPMTIDEAQEKRELLAKLYCASAFVAVVYVTYKIGKENKNFDYGTDTPTPRDVLNTLNVEGKVRVLELNGFRKVNEYVYNKDKPSEIIQTSKPVDENPDVQFE